MSKAKQEIIHEALQLSSEERAELVTTLQASLPVAPGQTVDEAWAAEITRRAERVHTGHADGRAWEEVRARLEQRRR